MTKKKHGWYEEGKVRVNISLTQTSIESLDRQATRLGMSRSELIETMARQEQSLLPEEKQHLGKLFAS
ncbi:CopG family transcriptional regulator [Nostocaceae cyanobacterium CENA357]|uniref:CopG family transcriptional regulator n=1 Tax=Atlanticothrix silvestris CENA357 TaxID=1725252 RepID=A0A8J7HDW3_9CYAN|nr:CopG family transcriptional regulator [Atlanticothrix silvestris CENA357]